MDSHSARDGPAPRAADQYQSMPGGAHFSAAPDVHFGPLELLLVAVLISLILISVVGNCLVCVAIFTDRRLRKLGNAFIVSLAIADLFVSCLVMTFALCNDLMNYWLFGDWFCDVWISFDIMCCTASILNLCAISLDRFIHIKDCLFYNQWMTRRVAVSAVIVIWIISALVSFVPINLGWHKPEHHFGSRSIRTLQAQHFGDNARAPFSWSAAAGEPTAAANLTLDVARATRRLSIDSGGDSNSIRAADQLEAGPRLYARGEQTLASNGVDPQPRRRRRRAARGSAMHASKLNYSPAVDEARDEPIDGGRPPERSNRDNRAATRDGPNHGPPNDYWTNNESEKKAPTNWRALGPLESSSSGRPAANNQRPAGERADGLVSAAGANNQAWRNKKMTTTTMNNSGAGNELPTDPLVIPALPSDPAASSRRPDGPRAGGQLLFANELERREFSRARRQLIKEEEEEELPERDNRRPLEAFLEGSRQRRPPSTSTPSDDQQQQLPQCMLTLTPTYAVVSSTISFYIPCIIMLGLYSKLFACARRHVKNIRATSKAPLAINSTATAAATGQPGDNKRTRRLNFLARRAGRSATAAAAATPPTETKQSDESPPDDEDEDARQSSFSCTTTFHPTGASTGCGSTSGNTSGASAQQVASGANLDAEQRRPGRPGRRLFGFGRRRARAAASDGELLRTARTWIKFGRQGEDKSGGRAEVMTTPMLKVNNDKDELVIDRQLPMSAARLASAADLSTDASAQLCAAVRSAPLIDADADEQIIERVVRRLDRDGGAPAEGPQGAGWREEEPFLGAAKGRPTSAARTMEQTRPNANDKQNSVHIEPAANDSRVIKQAAREQQDAELSAGRQPQQAAATSSCSSTLTRSQKSITFKLNLGGTKISNKLNNNRKSWLPTKANAAAAAAGAPTANNNSALGGGSGAASSQSAEKQHSQLATHKAAVTLGIIMGTFLFCWVPFFCLNIIKAFCVDCIPSSMFRFFTWLGYANSALNPIIYGIHNSEFRNAFNRIFFKHLSIKNGRQYLNRRFSYDLRHQQTSGHHHHHHRQRLQQQQQPLVQQHQQSAAAPALTGPDRAAAG